MSKKKQKKRAKQGDGQVITTANPLYGVARLFESKTLGEIRKNIKDAKEYGRKLCIVTNTDLSNNETLIVPNGSRLNFYFEKMDKETDGYYLYSIRTLSRFQWLKSRNIYRITQEALEFLNSNNDLFDNDVVFHAAIQRLSKPGIVCFPDGTGFFFAPTNIPNQKIADYVNKNPDKVAHLTEGADATLSYYISGFDEFHNELDTFIMKPRLSTTLEDVAKGETLLIRALHEPLSEHIEKTMKEGDKLKTFEDKNGVLHITLQKQQLAGEQYIERNKLVAKTLIFLSAILFLNPSDQKMIGFKPEGDTPLNINLVTISGVDPKWTFPPYINGYQIPKYGVHPYYGFLSAGTMRTYLRDLDPSNPETDKQFGDARVKEEFLVLKNWVEHGTVFSASDDVLKFCKDRYGNETYNWPEMLKELPVKQFFVSMDDEYQFTLIAVEKQHLYLSDSMEDYKARHIPYMSLAISKPTDYKDEHFPELLSLIVHICGYYKKRREIQEVKRLQGQSSNPAAGGMSRRVGSKPADDHYRNGYDIDLDQIRLLDVTTRAVKNTTRKARMSRYGWRMPTHVRQAHKHRFWVGSGENRHLEERWVDTMIINKDNESNGVIHKVCKTNEN